MRRIGIVVGFVGVLALSSFVLTQERPPEGDPARAFLLPAATVLATAKALPQDRGNASDVYLERHTGMFPDETYAYRIGMEHRLPNFPQAASVHEKEAELWGVIDGSLTVTTGGKLINPRQNGTNWGSSEGITGGTPNRVGRGDFLMIPEGVPHQVTAVEGDATLVTFETPRPRATYTP